TSVGRSTFSLAARPSPGAQVRLWLFGGGETMRRPLACLLLLVGGFLSTQVSTQEFPSKPVHIMVGAAPGGLIDLFARTYGTKLQERSRQPVLVENNSVA